ncbi:methylglyoxal reductase (NADPH-dependent) gre2 [Rhizophlyctis rosea]|uniref:Methylglyoxal reductase (NADPH-dependent) gre2 n=1 Tax=Rhizophlyctis rosea TaxID=64517 RepID=A0AAD5S4X7_9FUNG|nr:methylglyoxal reductase (NADPH-dependent) gre2 [Rhizophlyctis rosea]
MPALKAPAKILVTGVTGYIAAHVAEQLLQLGFSVRGSVRDLAKAEYLKKRWAQHGDKIEFVVISDLVKKEGFDEAVKGVDGIAHVASPFHFNVRDAYADLINPAVKGTTSVLESALSQGNHQIKRIVVTSSFAALAHPAEPGYKFTEADWNDWAIKEVNEKGATNVDAGVAYRASKSEAEKAAWNFIKEKQPKFDVATINPVFVFGPAIHNIPNADSIPTSLQLFYRNIASDPQWKNTQVAPSNSAQAFIDVRDVAKAHVEALIRPEAGGQRFLVSAGNFSWQEAANVLRELYPERNVVVGEPEKIRTGEESIVYGEKASRELDISYRPFKEVARDSAEYLIELEKSWRA